MIVSNVTLAELEAALQETSNRFGGNVRWNRSPEALNRACTRFRLTLRCVSSAREGRSIRRNPFTHHTRNLIFACWHVHGTFFDFLPVGATILSRGQRIHPHDAWVDFNIGSVLYPCYASESCSCNGGH